MNGQRTNAEIQCSYSELMNIICSLRWRYFLRFDCRILHILQVRRVKPFSACVHAFSSRIDGRPVVVHSYIINFLYFLLLHSTGSPEKISLWLQGHRRQFVNGRHRPHTLTHRPSTIGDIHLFLSSRLSTIHNLNIRTASTTCKYE